MRKRQSFPYLKVNKRRNPLIKSRVRKKAPKKNQREVLTEYIPLPEVVLITEADYMWGPEVVVIIIPEVAKYMLTGVIVQVVDS
ncbi:hypothetical protein [Elizabethkingia miricola]|uniref:hypothetical protein n=1 Tax=Elizabethkingia miricola TaxID=172045 RepID=UPI003891F0E7